MKRIKTNSGISGWQCRLRENYTSLEEWTTYAETYNLCARLGFADAESAWEANPLIQGSTNPGDFRRVAEIPPLSDGATYCILNDGTRRCTGSHLGRRNVLPIDYKSAAPKLRLVRLRLVDFDYDSGGAYWGGAGLPLYRAVAVLPVPWQRYFGETDIFVRAKDRAAAKHAVRNIIPLATFFS